MNLGNFGLQFFVIVIENLIFPFKYIYTTFSGIQNIHKIIMKPKFYEDGVKSSYKSDYS